MIQFRISPFWRQFFVTATIFVAGVGHGSMGGFPSILLPQLAEQSYISYTEEAGSWLASVTGITSLIGSVLTPPIMGRLGRKVTQFAVTSSLAVGWIIIILSSNVETMIIGRAIQGWSMGMTLPLRSVIVGECTSPKYRGGFLTTISISQALGILIVHLIGSLISWQKTILILLSFPLSSFLMTIFIPETPSWLADKGKHDECRKVFYWLRGHEENKELEDMIDSSGNKTDPIAKCGNIFTFLMKKEFYTPLIIMSHCYLLTHFSGGTIIVGYSTRIIELVSGPETNAEFWMVALSIQRLISNIIAIFFVDRFRRKLLILWIGSICVLSNIAIACYTYAVYINAISTSTWIPILLLNILYFTVAIGMNTLPYVIAGEIFPLQYRSIGSSLSTVSSSSSYFVVMKTFNVLVESVGIYGAHVVYAAIISYSLVVIGFLLPETKGKTLQQIEKYFKGNKC